MSLSGRKGWLITDGKAGMNAQCVGVAEALNLDYEFKKVIPKGIWRLLAPRGPVSPSEKFASSESPFAPPWPDIAFATGRHSIPYIRALKQKAPEIYTVILQDPRMGSNIADLIWVPEHDKLRGENVITTLTAPHAFSPGRLRGLLNARIEPYSALPRPRISILLGGPNAVYKYTSSTITRLIKAVSSLAELGASFMITPSRRTPEDLIDSIDQVTRMRPHFIWDGSDQNPYELFLAYADALIVTADSVNMTGEACATGRPVFVFEPDGGSKKFRTFHNTLRQYGATRELPQAITDLESWSYQPLDSATLIADEIERRWQAR